MTKDEALELARKYTVGGLEFDAEGLALFVALVIDQERERLLQAVEEMRSVQNNSLLQNKPPEFWIRSFKQAIEAKGQA